MYVTFALLEMREAVIMRLFMCSNALTCYRALGFLVGDDASTHCSDVTRSTQIAADDADSDDSLE